MEENQVELIKIDMKYIEQTTSVAMTQITDILNASLDPLGPLQISNARQLISFLQLSYKQIDAILASEEEKQDSLR